MMKNILALTCNDLAVALKNKTLYLILFIPFFVFISLELIDRTDVEVSKIGIGLLQNYPYAPRIMHSVEAAGKIIEITWIQNEEQGKRLLKEKKIAGVLLGNEKAPGTLVLLVLKKESLHTLAVAQIFSALQKAAEGHSTDWIADIKALHTGDLQTQTLPTWILMLVLLVGFIILPAQVAEEKEKKLLLALLQTPIREVQWLIAKVITGMILVMIAIFVLHLLGGFGVVKLFDYIAFIVAGSFCFSAFGIFLGFLCRSQASARTLGVLVYLPLLLPAALTDFSQKLTVIAPLLPSYQFYKPLQAILFEDGGIADMPFDLAYLFLLGSMTFYFSYLLLKRRWLM